MAHGKSLELKKIKCNSTPIGNYVQAANKSFRDFKPGDIVYSRDGVTKYLVQENGSFRRITAAMEKFTEIVSKVNEDKKVIS